MRISFLLSSLNLSGGVRVVVQYANRLSNRGHQVALIIPKGAVDKKIEGEIDQAVKIYPANSPLTRKNPIELMWLTWQMARVVPKSDVIIATHTPTTAVSLFASKLLNRGKIIWFYMDYKEMFDKRPVERWLLKNALRWHDYAITFSEACIQELHSSSAGKVINVGLGLDITHVYYPRSDIADIKHTYSGKKLLLYVGDARPRKGLHDFIHAAEMVYEREPNLYLLVASKEEIDLQTSVPHESILCPTDEELVHLYSACDIFVSASWYEGFGLPALEAMACGAAVVTTDSRGMREYAIDRENCIIVPPKNPPQLADAILLLLTDNKLAEHLRKNGPATASRFNWDHAVDRFEKALTEPISH